MESGLDTFVVLRGVRASRVRSRRRAVINSSTAPCQGFAQASRRLMVARGGRMIAAISIGIIIIITVIIAALAIIYFILK